MIGHGKSSQVFFFFLDNLYKEKQVQLAEFYSFYVLCSFTESENRISSVCIHIYFWNTES